MSKKPVATLTFVGGLDISRYPEIAGVFRNAPADGDAVIVDLSRVTWIDSVFVTELLVFIRRNLKNRRAVIIVSHGHVAHMLAVAGLQKKVQIVADYDVAVDALEKRRSDARPFLTPPPADLAPDET